jgi:hypothetical protein
VKNRLRSMIRRRANTCSVQLAWGSSTDLTCLGC